MDSRPSWYPGESGWGSGGGPSGAGGPSGPPGGPGGAGGVTSIPHEKSESRFKTDYRKIVRDEVPSQKYVHEKNIIKDPGFYWTWKDPITQKLNLFYPESLHRDEPQVIMNKYGCIRIYNEDGLRYEYVLKRAPSTYVCRIIQEEGKNHQLKDPYDVTKFINNWKDRII